MKKKNILTIVLVLVVVLLAGASYYIATQLINKQAVAPTAPSSKPKAECIEACPRADGVLVNCTEPFSDNNTQQSICTTAGRREFCGGNEFCCPTAGGAWTRDLTACPEDTATENTNVAFVGSSACTLLATASATACTPSGVITCSPDCPTACGTAASTITTCTDSCGTATTKSCAATDACEQAVLQGIKTAYKNETANTVGRYTLTTEIETVAKSQIYVYSIVLTNDSDANATSVTIKDSLANVPEVTFMDAVSGCNFNATNKELTCNTTVNKDETKTFSFRVKAGDGIVNGEVITNTAIVTYDGGDQLELVKDLPISTVVDCNHTCTTDEECSGGLVCSSNKCRNTACVNEDDCTCNIIITTTKAPTVTKTTTVTATPTEKVVAEATPTILPETGIFDLPGIAAFGGGLILAVVGILLAL